MSAPLQPNGMPASSEQDLQNGGDATAKPKKSLFAKAKTLWSKTGIDARTYKMMFKGAIAPTIAIAIFQADAFAHYYSTVGYLVGIMSILSIVIRPRAVFLQTMLLNVLFLCTSAAVVVLAFFCCVKARQNSEPTTMPGTGGPGTSGMAASGAATATYNSSSSAVAGVWLVVLIYFLSTIRALKPQYMIPSIIGSIIANVGMVYAPQFSTMVQAEVLVRKLLTAILTGLGIGTAVSLFIFPVTNRTVIFADMKGYVSSLRAALGANMAYVRSLEEVDMFTARRTETARHRPEQSPEAKAVKGKIQALNGIAAKFATDLPFAKREVALGYLGPDDIQQIGKLLRMVLVPMVGLSCLSDIFERIAEDRNWSAEDDPSANPSAADIEAKTKAIEEWHSLTRMLREPLQELADVIDSGLEHAMLVLRLAPAPKEADVEAKGSDIRPGQDGFAALLAQRTENFNEKKQHMLRAFCKLHGVELPADYFQNPSSVDIKDPDWANFHFDSDYRLRSRRQLYLTLYLEYLLWSIGRRTLDLVNFAEKLKSHGKLDKRRLVVPGAKRLNKWVRSLVRPDPDTHPDHQTEGNDNVTTVYLGSAYSQKKDPMHLPPENIWERFGERVRKVAHFLGSPASVFGFRVACATMSIAIVAYLRDTQIFYTEQRLFWAQIMVNIGMQPSAGQGLRTSIFRIVGTGMFMVVAWICWYIVDGQTAGVLVFYFIFLHIGPWIILKYPAYITLGMIGPVTMTLIIGYELQVRKIGVALATSNGQKFYPVYELGPIRLATVVGGLALGYFWTVFPYPISEHAEQRKSLGSALYLLSNYNSVMHETVRARLKGVDDDSNVKGSPGYKLDKARRTVYSKNSLLLSGMRARTGFLKYDIPVGGKFPRKQYDEIIGLLQSILNFMALVSYASTSFTELRHKEEDSSSEWLRTFRKLVGDANMTSQSVTTLLSLMSAAVSNGQALPPYLHVPEPYALSRKLDELDSDLLSVRHISEPGFAAFSVIQIGTKCIIDDLKKLLPAVKELVGEQDFSFHVISTADSASNDSEVTLTMRKGQENTVPGNKQD